VGDFSERFGDIVRGLVSLEVNTIIKDGMSASAMGEPREALHDIANCYWRWLHDHDSKGPAPPDPVTQSYFTDLAQAADAVRSNPASGGEVVVLASRIRKNSLRMTKLFDQLTGPNPDPDELVQLRKVWEVGTERVVMQTVLWLDGDAVQRIHPDYLGKEHEQLLAVHSANVNAALGYWKSLGDLLVSLFQSVWHKLTA
jgi:hypothetical protein